MNIEGVQPLNILLHAIKPKYHRDAKYTTNRKCAHQNTKTCEDDAVVGAYSITNCTYS
jgi:hypothetical protein